MSIVRYCTKQYLSTLNVRGNFVFVCPSVLLHSVYNVIMVYWIVNRVYHRMSQSGMIPVKVNKNIQCTPF